MKLRQLFCAAILASAFSCFGQTSPAISTQPASKTVTQGGSATFSVIATGGSLSYQWRFNSTNIAGATSSVYTRSNAQPADEGSYSVTVTNVAGSITSSPALLTVNVPPAITTQPESQTNVVGDTIILDVAASGTDNPSCPMTYQWRKNNNAIAGKTDSFMYIDPVQAADAGSYTVRVQNCAGAVTSAVAVITVYVPPTIVTQPQTQTKILGSNVAFTVKVGTANPPTQPVTYQWYHDGETVTNSSRISGATSTNLTILNVATDDDGDYQVLISNPATAFNGDYVYSDSATLTVVIPPTINSVTVEPDDGRIVQDGTAIFTVDAEGSDDLIYQWRKNGLAMAGETEEVLVIDAAQPGDAADYSVVVQSTAVNAVSPAAIKAISSAIRLTVFVPPTITVQPQSKSVSAGNNATFSVTATGTAPLAYQWKFNGDDIPGATNSIYTFLATSTSQSGAYSVTVSNEAVALGADEADSNEANLTVVAERTNPTITITSPADGSRNSNAVLVVRGTSSDNAEVSTIYWTLNQTMNDLNQQPANGTTDWTVTVPLTLPGTNTFRVRSRDSSGNYSATLLRKFVYVLSDRFTLITNGVGSVSPNLGGQVLEIGKQHTLTAKPGVGQVFSGWTGGVISTNPKVTFTMQSNLVLRVNFIPNPFIPRKGTYSGLFYRTNGVEHQSSGFFTLKLTDKGAFSCKLQLGGAKYAGSGIFNLQGTASATITRSGLSPLQLTFSMDLTNQTDQVFGTVSDGAWVAALSGDRAVFNATLNPAPQAAKYTMAFISQSGGSATIPNGDGFGTVNVDAAGKVSLKGTLADGVKASQKTYISKFGQWPFYANIYAGKGSMIGWLTFTNTGTSSIEGNASWIKTSAAIGKNYLAGFDTDVTAAGSRYTPPLAGTRVLNLTTGSVILSGGGLSPDITNAITLNANNSVTVTSGSNNLALTLTVTSGAAKGSFLFPGTGASTPIKGIILREQNVMRGFFLTPTQSGAVLLGP